MHLFHAPPRRGHYDGKRTYEAAKPHAYWPNMQREITLYCTHCIKCQYYNKRARKPGPYPRSLPERPWQVCSADIAGPFPASAKGNKYILVMQDMLTRSLKLACMKHATADEVVKHFVDRILREEGTPETVLTDRGTHFTAQLYKGICLHVGINHTTTTAYRPQCNGANERSHRELNRFLSIYMDKTRPQDWDLLVKEAEWSHNTTYHASLKRSPYEALRAFPPPLHGLGPAFNKEHPLMKKALEDTSFEMPDEVVLRKYFHLLDKEIIEARDQIYHHLNRIQEGHKELLKLEKNKYLDLDNGDLVLLEQPGTAIKGDPKKYNGPYRVVRKYSPAVYKIEDPTTKRWQIVNQARLKKYKPPNRFDEIPATDPSEKPVEPRRSERLAKKRQILSSLDFDDDETAPADPVVPRPPPALPAQPPATSGPTTRSRLRQVMDRLKNALSPSKTNLIMI